MEHRLELVHLRSDSGIDARVCCVHIDCITAGALHCHVVTNLHEAPTNSYES